MNWALTTDAKEQEEGPLRHECAVSPSPCWRGSGSSLPCYTLQCRQSDCWGERLGGAPPLLSLGRHSLMEFTGQNPTVLSTALLF